MPLFQSSLIISFTVLVDCLRTNNGLSVGEFDNTKMYSIFGLININYVSILF